MLLCIHLLSLKTYNIDIFGSCVLGVLYILSVDYAISCLLFYLDAIVGIKILFLSSCSLNVI